MRTYGRIKDPVSGLPKWVEVDPDQNGAEDFIWVTTLIQVLKLNLGESPFYANYGIPAKPSVVQQVQPDFYVSRTQQQFAPFFANLMIAKTRSFPDPVYQVNVTLNNGVKINAQVPIAT